MAGRPRRNRDKMPQPHMKMAQAPSYGGRHLKEESSLQLHDDADLINFRSDALHRYISNQEYLENIALKPIHNSKIIPPATFPVQAKNKRDDNSEENLKKILLSAKPEEFYFGDLKLMQTKEKLLQQEIETIKSGSSDVFDEEYVFQSAKTQELAEAFAKMSDYSSAEQLEQKLNQVSDEYKQKYQKTYRASPGVKKYTIPVSVIKPDLEVLKAPANYNPKLINSLLGMGNNNNDNNSHDFDMDNMAGAPPGVDMAPFANDQFLMQQLQNQNDNLDLSFQNRESEGMDDINQLLSRDMVNDDMNDLINFQDDGEMMSSNAFDADFLSQIDHSME